MLYDTTQSFSGGSCMVRKKNRIFLSIDMDEWYQCRWATGSKTSLWPNTKCFFRDYYNSDRPIGEIIKHTEVILSLLSDHRIRATFFFTGEIASYYPELVERVSDEGHEIASHNFVHKDYNELNLIEFTTNLRESKKLLEKLSGQKIIGYRAPNSVVSPSHIRELIISGFKYDSSVTPTRPLFGQFGRFTKCPLNPYRLSDSSFYPGDSELWEFPWPALPILRLPAGSGITTRMFGYTYAILAIEHALRTGNTAYYFHPYEIGPSPRLKTYGSFYAKFRMRNLDGRYLSMLKSILNRFEGYFISGNELLELELVRE
jgi:peptidoglycan/xylan/chitin deacetylase (PgdA/CDA1 family)